MASPPAIRRFGFVQVKDKLYIQGGYSSTTFVQGFHVLDLSTSWSTSQANWKSLPNGPLTSHHALAASADGQTFLSIGGLNNPPFVATINLTGLSTSWTDVSAGKLIPFSGLEGHVVVTDPNSGLIYVFGGNQVSAAPAELAYNGVMTLDAKTGSFSTIEPASMATSLTDAGAVWSTTRKTILVVGGSLAPPALPIGLELATVKEFDPATRTWKQMTTSGDIPPARFDHCVAISEDGSKLVVFGGAKDSTVSYSSLYILDVASGVWRQGKSADKPRTKFGCALHAGQFIAFGGSEGAQRATMLDNVPLVYHLEQNQWVDRYDASATPSSADGGSSSSKVGLIAGIAAGVVFLIVLVAGIWWMRRRKQKQSNGPKSYDSDAKVTAAAAAAMGYGADGEYHDPKAWNPAAMHSPFSPHQQRYSQVSNQNPVEGQPLHHVENEYALDPLRQDRFSRYDGGSGDSIAPSAYALPNQINYSQLALANSHSNTEYATSVNTPLTPSFSGVSNTSPYQEQQYPYSYAQSPAMTFVPSPATTAQASSAYSPVYTSPPPPHNQQQQQQQQIVPMPPVFGDEYMGKVSYYEPDTASNTKSAPSNRISVGRAPQLSEGNQQQFYPSPPARAPQVYSTTETQGYIPPP
ncbi:hypothetical protein BGZ94_008399 [Podila epigama]|nr:hypothetical protein BGZ94_008399 [Podila epigama]